jgi:hypothetical protein
MIAAPTKPTKTCFCCSVKNLSFFDFSFSFLKNYISLYFWLPCEFSSSFDPMFSPSIRPILFSKSLFMFMEEISELSIDCFDFCFYETFTECFDRLSADELLNFFNDSIIYLCSMEVLCI